MVLGDDLDGFAFGVGVEDEVLDDVEKATFLAGGAEDGFEADAAGLGLGFYLLPLVEVLPGPGEAADYGGAAVGQDDEGVLPEQVRDGVFVIEQEEPQRGGQRHGLEEVAADGDHHIHRAGLDQLPADLQLGLACLGRDVHRAARLVIELSDLPAAYQLTMQFFKKKVSDSLTPVSKQPGYQLVQPTHQLSRKGHY